MMNLMAQNPKSADMCKLGAYLSAIFELCQKEGAKGKIQGLDIYKKFVHDKLLQHLKDLKHDGKDCEVCKAGKDKFIDKLISLIKIN